MRSVDPSLLVVIIVVLLMYIVLDKYNAKCRQEKYNYGQYENMNCIIL